MVQIVNTGFHLGHLQGRALAQGGACLVDLQLHAVNDQFATQVRQHRPGQIGRVLQAGRHIRQLGTRDLRADSESAIFRIDQRQLVNLALDLKAHRAGLAVQHRITHVIACCLVNRQRQVTIDTFAVGPAQVGLQVQHTWVQRA